MRRRRLLPDGTLGPLEDVFGEKSPEEKVEELEIANAQLVYNSMMKELEIEALKGAQTELQDSHAELLYTLMMNGVV